MLRDMLYKFFGIAVKFLSGYINNNRKDIGIRATNAINKLTESREDFQKSIRNNFDLLYPKFINHLKQIGLSEENITICYQNSCSQYGQRP